MGCSSQELAVFLALSSLPGVGFKRLRALGGIPGVFALYNAEGVQGMLEKLSIHGTDIGVMEFLDLGYGSLKLLSERNIKLVSIAEPEYPDAFYHLAADVRPLWFFYEGQIDLLKKPAVAVVGTRSPNQVGEFLTRYAVSLLRDLDLSVVSGLARGIDETAHEWANMVGAPNISVLANGLLRTYPAKNADLARKIVDSGGVLISEALPDADPTKEAFVWRNRLQAALGKAVIAPQWLRTSGTAHTINFAKRLRRPTINLQLTGATADPDHGVAETSFIVPHQHAQLIRELDEAKQAGALETNQTAFSFGDIK